MTDFLAPRTRHGEVADLITEMRSAVTSGDPLEEGWFAALGMLITDSVLSHDSLAVSAAHDGLRRLYGTMIHHDYNRNRPEKVGRVLGMIDITNFALRRIR